MKLSRLFKFRYLSVYIYLLLSKVHWKPREKVIEIILDKISEEFGNKKYRIVDIGCGPGLLVKVVEKKGFYYLGIDNNLNSIEFCQEIYSDKSMAEFTVDNIEDDSIQFTKNDIIVLNGVAHHLNDFQMNNLLKKALPCFAIIIADHLRKSPNLSLINFFPLILQNLDRGKFIRLYNKFDSLSNYTLYYSEEFAIGVAGITFWTYFCNFYRSNSV